MVVSVEDNYQTINQIKFDAPIKTKGFIIDLVHPDKENVPASVFEIYIN